MEVVKFSFEIEYGLGFDVLWCSRVSVIYRVITFVDDLILSAIISILRIDGEQTSPKLQKC